MSTAPQDSDVANVSRMLRIIIIVLLVSVLGFLAIVGMVISLTPNQGQASKTLIFGNLPLMTTVAFAFAAIIVPLSILVPRLQISTARRKIVRGTWVGNPVTPPGDLGKLSQVYLAQGIIGATFNVGAAFFVAIVYMIERNPTALALVLFLIVAIAARFPTRDRVDRWMQTQLTQLAAARQANG